MKRREFITLVTGFTAMWPLAARAQQGSGLPTIGIMGAGSASVQSKPVAALMERLRDLGWNDRKTATIDYQWVDGHRERMGEIVAEFVRSKVDVIVTNSTPAVLAAKQATSEIPIIFPTAGDPVGTGLVASLAHPGGNVTGLGFQTTDTAGKRVQLLHEVVPDLHRLAILAITDDPSSTEEMAEAQKAATALSLESKIIGIQRAEEIAPALQAIKDQVDGLFVATSPPLFANRELISAFAMSAKLPATFSIRPYVDAGGLMSYGADFPQMWRRAAEMVDKVLRGTKPADIPVEQPTKFELVINLKTAKALGLTIPPGILSIADELIE
jgi:putative tryptophan/tyrosine transport system substrate-binding protein